VKKLWADQKRQDDKIPVVPNGEFFPMKRGKALEELLGEFRVKVRNRFTKVWSAINTNTDEI